MDLVITYDTLFCIQKERKKGPDHGGLVVFKAAQGLVFLE
jgi:hypothetical protein